MIFLDTSAIYAMADQADPRHERAKEQFKVLLAASEGISYTQLCAGGGHTIEIVAPPEI